MAPGGIVIYDDSLPIAARRHDVIYYGMPVSQLVKAANLPFELRDYIANMVYVGVLAHLLGIDLAEIEAAVAWNFGGKPKPTELNMSMVRSAYEWGKANLVKRDPYRVATDDRFQRGQNPGGRQHRGRAGRALRRHHGASPGTRSRRPPAWLTRSASTLPQLRTDPETGKATFAIIQAEDEMAAMGMVIGAGWAGARAMTSTSGPGLDLMAEFAGLAYFAEVPAVIWDVQRIGPSTGLPTRTSQGDIAGAYYLSHGDTRHVLLFPADPKECFEFGATAFDLAERLQTPVIVLSDLDLGMNIWASDPFEYPEKPLDRGKVLSAEDIRRLGGAWARYRDVDGDGIGWRTLPGTRSSRGGLLHPRHRPQRECHLQRAARGLGAQHGAPRPQIRDGSQPGARPDRGRGRRRRDRHHQHRLEPSGRRRGARICWRKPASRAATCDYAPCRSTRPCAISSRAILGCSW